jgi:hypothetical protein
MHARPGSAKLVRVVFDFILLLKPPPEADQPQAENPSGHTLAHPLKRTAKRFAAILCLN